MSGVRTREIREREELDRLAPYAAKSAESCGRENPESEHAYRSAFQRDRDRIIHSRAFRRLEYKTQVFVCLEGDHYRNRLTHTIENAQIARTMARALYLNEDLAEAVSLAHDLGHPPFAHAGEYVLDELMRDHGGFDHNRQSLRVVDLLEHRYPQFRGLNLSGETREGLLKHGCDWPHPAPLPKLGYQGSLEAQVANLADEIAYTNHDLDDGLQSGILELEMLDDVPLWREACESVDAQQGRLETSLHRSQVIIHLINRLVTDVVESSVVRLEKLAPGSVDEVRATRDLLVGYSDPIHQAKRELKEFLREHFYHHPSVRREAERAQHVLADLFRAHSRDPSLVPEQYFREEGEMRVIADYLSGMTDRYAMTIHGQLMVGNTSSLPPGAGG